MQFLRQVARLLGKAQVGRDDDRVGQPFLTKMVRQNGERGQHVAGDVEKALNLIGVQVERDVSIGTGDADHVSHQAGGDRHAGLILLVGAPVCQVGNDRRDAVGRGPIERIQKDQQLHQVVIDRRRGGLDQKDVLAAYALVQPHKDILVGKRDDIAPRERHAEIFADPLGERRATRAAEQFDRAVRTSQMLTHSSQTPTLGYSSRIDRDSSRP